jgi:hypothetical protein
MDLPGCNPDALWNLRLRDTVAAVPAPMNQQVLGSSATLGCHM